MERLIHLKPFVPLLPDGTTDLVFWNTTNYVFDERVIGDTSLYRQFTHVVQLLLQRLFLLFYIGGEQSVDISCR